MHQPLVRRKKLAQKMTNYRNVWNWNINFIHSLITVHLLERTRRTEILTFPVNFTHYWIYRSIAFHENAHFCVAEKAHISIRFHFFVDTHKFFWRKWVQTFLMSRKKMIHKKLIKIEFISIIKHDISFVSNLRTLSFVSSVFWYQLVDHWIYSSLGLNRFDSMTPPVWMWLVIELYISKQHFIEL